MNARAAPSAKGLFRATKAKQAGGAPLPMELPKQPKPAERREHDAYLTFEPDPIRALLALDWSVIAPLGAVWEPAAGKGHLAREIADAGLQVFASDLVDRGRPGIEIADFYVSEQARAPAIITNPPYAEINARDGHGRWLRHTLALPGWEYLALLLSWEWPAAKANGFGALLEANPFSYVYLMRWKIDFTGEGNPSQRNAWFVWRRGWRGAPMQIRFMDREDGDQLRQSSMF